MRCVQRIQILEFPSSGSRVRMAPFWVQLYYILVCVNSGSHSNLLALAFSLASWANNVWLVKLDVTVSKYFLKNIWRVSSGAQGCQIPGGLRVQMCCIPSLVWSSGLCPDFTNRVNSNSPFSLSKSCLWFVFSQETVCFVLINYVSENLPLVSRFKA